MSSASYVFLVRHAKAGERRIWDGDDEHRPLSKQGWWQAEALGKRLAGKGATSLHSSPYVRCMDTLVPLGRRIGVDVIAEPRLAEGGPFEPVLELMADVPDGAVLCSHGDIVPDVIGALVRRGLELQTPVDWRKGTVWLLKRKNDRFTKGKVWPPPHR